MCTEYIQVNMYQVSAQGVDQLMINVHCYYYNADARSVVTTETGTGQQTTWYRTTTATHKQLVCVQTRLTRTVDRRLP